MRCEAAQKRAVVYGKLRQRECASIAEGLTTLGYDVCWRNHGYWDPQTGPFADASVVATFGQRLWSAVIAETYRNMGIPVLTVDLPPLRVSGLEDTHRALWLNHVNWIPGGLCPADRMQQLGLTYSANRSSGRRVLLCGQTPDDAAHGMKESDLRTWANSAAEILGREYSVFWRPHPRYRFRLAEYPICEPERPIEDVLSEEWCAIATFNSTAGLTAILCGLPVFCSPGSFYVGIANALLADLPKPCFPTIGELARFFSRLAYTMWTFDELASGEALNYVLPLAEAA